MYLKEFLSIYGGPLFSNIFGLLYRLIFRPKRYGNLGGFSFNTLSNSFNVHLYNKGQSHSRTLPLRDSPSRTYRKDIEEKIASAEIAMVHREERRYEAFTDDRKARVGTLNEVQSLILYGFEKHRFLSLSFLRRNSILPMEQGHLPDQIEKSKEDKERIDLKTRQKISKAAINTKVDGKKIRRRKKGKKEIVNP